VKHERSPTGSVGMVYRLAEALNAIMRFFDDDSCIGYRGTIPIQKD
jgi:hypothetical protein